MKKLILLSCIIFALSILTSCGDESSENPQPVIIAAVQAFQIIDYGNSGSATDFFVRFQPSTSEGDIDSYQLILVKANGSTTLDVTTAKNLAADRSFRISKSGTQFSQSISAQFNDIDGDPIRNDQRYNAYLYAKPKSAGNDGALSGRTSVLLEEKPYYEVQTFLAVAEIEAISYYAPGNFLLGPGPNHSLYKIDLEEEIYTQFANGLATPYGGGFDSATGDFYSSNYDNGEIWKFDLSGQRTRVASGLNGPTGIAVDKNGNVFVNNYLGSSITKIDTEGNVSNFSIDPSRLIQGPDGLVFVNDELYCINFDNSRIMKISENGTVTPFVTLPGTITGYITYGDGHFFATSPSLRKIYKIDLEGNYEEIAGSGKDANENGPAEFASFTNPNGICFAGDRIFVGSGGGIRVLIKHE